jgi:hypothetical protein
LLCSAAAEQKQTRDAKNKKQQFLSDIHLPSFGFFIKTMGINIINLRKKNHPPLCGIFGK